MLQIYLYGEKEEGYLDINPDTSLEIEALSNLFDEDLSTGEFSLPIEFPWTDNNRRKMGFAERLENFSKKQYYWRVDVYDDGWPEIINGKLTLLEKSGKFSYKRGKFNASISGTKGLFGTQIKNKKLSSLKLGGPITWSGKDSRQFAQDVMNGLHPELNYLAFAPVAIEDFFDKNRPDYSNEFLAKDTVNTIVVNGSTWTFGRPSPSDPSQAVASGAGSYMDYRTIPFFQLKYVFKKAFEEFGYQVSGGFLDEPGFNDLFIFNNYGIENYAPSANKDFNTTISPGNHMPDMGIADFINAVCGLFCCYPTFSMNEAVLHYRKDDFVNKAVLPLNDVVVDEFDSTLPAVDSNTGNGYKIGFTWDGNDGYQSDRVKDISDKTLVASVATVANLANLNIGRQLTTNDIAYVQADNLYYVIADGTSSPLKWDVYGEKLNEFTSGDGENSVDVNVSTLCTYVEFNSTTGLYEKRNYVGTRQKGSYINNKGIRVNNPFGLRLFFIQQRNVNGVTIPVSFNYNRDENNNKILPYNLAWQGYDGLAVNFHSQWQDFKQRMEVVKTNIIVNQKVLSDLEKYNVYEVDSVLYLPYQVTKKIPRQQTMEIRLVPL